MTKPTWICNHCGKEHYDQELEQKIVKIDNIPELKELIQAQDCNCN